MHAVEDSDVATTIGTHDPFAAPADPLAGTDVESCELYQSTRCEGGRRATCDLSIPWARGLEDDDPNPLVRRAFLFDRWYDLPPGPTARRPSACSSAPPRRARPRRPGATTRTSAAGAASATAGIWTGVGLGATMYRYLSTGTEADYARFERKVRAVLTDFEVTGIDGYLARYHFLSLPIDAPRTSAHYAWYGQTTFEATTMPIRDPASIPICRPTTSRGCRTGTAASSGACR